MKLWSFTRHTLRYLANHFLGPFFSRPLEPHQIQVADEKIICNDVYLKIEKINAILSGCNIPLVVCIAYVGHVAVNLNGKFEFSDLELVVQTTLRNFSPNREEMMDSLISDMTTPVVAPTTVADEEMENIGCNADFLGSSDSQIVQNIVEKIDCFIQNLGKPGCLTPMLIDGSALEQAAQLIDMLFLGTTIIFRDLRVRLQCPLSIPGAHRACDLRLHFPLLEIANELEACYKNASASVSATYASVATDSQPQAQFSATFPSVETSTLGENRDSECTLWSWIWSKIWFAASDYTSSQASSDKKAEGYAGSSADARKIIRFEGLTLHLDLWDTGNGRTRVPPPSTITVPSSMFTPFEDDINFRNGEFFSGPEPKSMVASGCILTLPGSDNYLTVHLHRNPSLMSKLIASPFQTKHNVVFNLDVDLGPLIACLCPSQIFWLGAMVTQLTKLYEAYTFASNAEKQNGEGCRSDNLDKGDQKFADSVDREISSDGTSTTSQMFDSNIYRSCLGASCFPSPDGDREEASISLLPPLSISAHCRFFALTIFYDDEKASFSNLFDLRSTKVDSSDSGEYFHETRTNRLDFTSPQGALRMQNEFFALLSDGEKSVLEYVLAGKRSMTSAKWLENLNLRLARLTENRDHLRLSLGQFVLEIIIKSVPDQTLEDDREEKVKKTGKEKIFGPNISMKGQADGLLFNECLFSHATPGLPLQIVNILSFAEADDALTQQIRLKTSADIHYIELAPCLIELDPSLIDRIHRITDSLLTVRDVSVILKQTISEAANLFQKSDKNPSALHKNHDQVGRRLWEDSHVKLNKPCQDESVDGHCGNSPFNGLHSIGVACPSLRINLRIPIPLECVPLLPGENLSNLRKRLWSNTANTGELFLAWWKPSLRPESLAIVVSDVFLNSGCRELRSSDVAYRIRFTRLEASFIGASYEEAFLIVGGTSSRKSSSITLRVTLKDRYWPQCVASPQKVKKRTPTTSSKRRSSSSSAMTMSFRTPDNSSSTAEPPLEAEIEEELLFNVVPKEDQRSPFVRKTMFLEGDWENVWDKVSLSPGDAKHLKFYNRLASQQSKFLLIAKLPSILLNIPNNEILELLYTRLLNDLALWKSLLPSNKRIRSVIKIGGGLRAPFSKSDHRYWSYGEFISLESVPAHPSDYLTAEIPNTPDLTENVDFEDAQISKNSISTSPFYISCSVESLEAHVRLNSSWRPTVSPPVAVLMAASVLITMEVNPCFRPDLVYTMLACDRLEFYILDYIESKCNSTGNEDISNNSKSSIPIVLPINLSEETVTEPMLSLAVEKKIIPVLDPRGVWTQTYSEDVTMAFKLRRTCVCYWPYFSSLLTRFPRPRTDLLLADYPSLSCPSCEIKTHWNLENFAFHMPSVSIFEAIIGSQKMEACPTGFSAAPTLDGIRSLIFAQTVTAFSRFALSSSYVALIEKVTLWLVPPQPVDSSKKSNSLRVSPSECRKVLLSAVRREIKALKNFLGETFDTLILRSVKVADLDQLVLRLVSEPISNSDATLNPPHRVDIRLSGNLIRLMTCIDSLVALRLILENLNRPLKYAILNKAADCPILTNPSVGDEPSHRRRIEGLISAAISDVDVMEDPLPLRITISKNRDEFIVIEKQLAELPQTPQPTRVLVDGTRVFCHRPSLNFVEDYFVVKKRIVPKKHGLFSDPPGSRSLSAFTIHDISFDWTLFGGLDFAYLCSGIDMTEDLQQPLSAAGIRMSATICRQHSQVVKLHLSRIYLRKSTFFPPFGTHVSIQRTGRIFTVDEPSFPVTSVTDIPVTRYTLRLADLKVVDGLPGSMVNHLFHVQQQNRATVDGRFIEAVRASALMWPSPTQKTSLDLPKPVALDYETEVKVSIQPLQVNLDQVTLIFLRTYNTVLNKLMERHLKDMEKRAVIFNLLPNDIVNWGDSTSVPQPCPTISVAESEPIFIKKLTLSRLPMRFNYNGHQLDLSQGTLLGLLALCLRLRNAELILPRWVYQRGYKGLGSLLEDILLHWTSILHSNLLQILATSIGPMHEISSIFLGVRDFVRHLVNALTAPAQSYQLDYRQRPSGDQVVQGLRSGIRALSQNAVWPVIELSSHGVRTAQYIFETIFDILSPGPSIRRSHFKPPGCAPSSTHFTVATAESIRSGDPSVSAAAPNDIREGVAMALQTIRRGVAHAAADFKTPLVEPNFQKGSIGTLGDVLRQIPPTVVVPLVIGCEVSANLLGGLRNQLRPEAKNEDKEKWKSGIRE